MRYAAAGAADGGCGIHQNRPRRQQMLGDLNRKFRAFSLDQCPFVASLPQRLGCRTPARKADETPTVRRDTIEERVGLILDLNPLGSKRGEQLRRIEGSIVLRGFRARTAANEAERGDAAAQRCTEVPSHGDGSGLQGHQRSSQIAPGVQQTLPDQRARTENRWLAAPGFKGTEGGFGDELIAPGQRNGQVKAQCAASVGQLNWPRRQRFDQRVCPDNENRQLFWRLA